MEWTVQKFAVEHNLTETMVYRHLAKIKQIPDYKEHITKKGKTYFDDTVANEIERRMNKTAIAIADTATQAERDDANAKLAEL